MVLWGRVWAWCVSFFLFFCVLVGGFSFGLVRGFVEFMDLE
jgi:hypothetical protein